jgi:hypothetical protein
MYHWQSSVYKIIIKIGLTRQACDVSDMNQ